MPKLIPLTNTVVATPSSNEVILFFVEESGVLKLKAKTSDGTIVVIMEETTP